MLSDEQIDWLADRLNEKVNLPIIGEKAEKAIITNALYKVLDVIEEELPPELVEFIDDATDGLEPQSEAEMDRIKDDMATFLNNNINLPLIGERKEQKVFEYIVDFIFEAMRKGKSAGEVSGV